ncbi:hypothetical protein QR680_018418 [Steinernema hermaphroditum]|uniref:Conserved oligomeric Golgi complex subunit 2 n=1 Tax=Steinernema hermaphroditum TaxID=289476 RepID=A0AA39HIU2_9BILA|nr:hypothetical protein QR680_018418 [Steinernema hermaphroditum]
MSADGIVASPRTTSDVQVSFNKTYFTRPDYDLERFLRLTRRHVTLEQLHADLKIYLKAIQNSLTELINNDHAEFVNISSNLVHLKDSIDAVKSGINASFAELSSSTAAVQKTAHFVERKIKELTENRKEQCKIRNRISLVLALKALMETLAKRPAEINHRWLDSLTCRVVSLEMWYQRSENVDIRLAEARERCLMRLEAYLSQFIVEDLKNEASYLPAILSILLLIGKTDGPTEIIGKSAVSPAMVAKSGRSLDQRLEKALQMLIDLQARWTTMLEKNGAHSEKVLSFLDQCLLTSLSDFLDKNITVVSAPSDKLIFHHCFCLVVEFIRRFRRFPATVALLRRIMDKFNHFV